MPNDSSTGGFLLPKGAPAEAPPTDAAFRAFLQSLLVGLTGLDADTGVRPSWQPTPPKTPEPTVNWVAFGYSAIPTDLEPEEEQLEPEDEEDPGGMVQTRNELVEVLVQCYGPSAGGYATQIRDALHVAQNREGMYSAGVGLIRVGRLVHVPEKRNGLWYDRWDLSLVLSRETRREFAQLHFLGAAGAVVADREEIPVQEFTAGNQFVPPEP